MVSDTGSGQRRASLDAARAASIGRAHFGFGSPRAVGLPGAGCAVDAERAVAMVSESTMAVVGGVLIWSQNQGVALEAVIVDHDSGSVDGWLDGFSDRPAVFELDGTDLTAPAPPVEVPAPITSAVPPAFDLADVDVVIENGIVRAEVDGLEVARVVVYDDGSERVEVGVGQFDRAGHKVMSADRSVADSLGEVASAVRAARHRGAPAHTFNRLCRERWLRSVLVAHPELVGLVELEPVDPVPARSGLLDTAPAPAMGRDPEGEAVLVMSSSGIDPGLAPSTSAIARRERPTRIVVALPLRDLVAPTQRLLATLRWPVELVGVQPPWV